MMRVRFTRDKVYKVNGKLFPMGKVTVLDDEILEECLADGSAVPHGITDVTEEIINISKKSKTKKR